MQWLIIVVLSVTSFAGSFFCGCAHADHERGHPAPEGAMLFTALWWVLAQVAVIFAVKFFFGRAEL